MRGRLLRIMSTLNGDPRDPNDQGRLATGETALPPSSEAPVEAGDSIQPPRPSRGRGAFILSQVESRTTQTPQEPAQPAREPQRSSSYAQREQKISNDEGSRQSDSNSSSNGHLRRQGSDLSNSSVVSSQFANTEHLNYKATLSKRPSTIGEPIPATVNSVTFGISAETPICEYHVEFNPNIESIRLRYQILRTDEAKRTIGDVMNWTGTNLYLPIKLPSNQTVFQTVHPVTHDQVNVSINFVKNPPQSELLQFYNSLMHKIMMRQKFVLINRQHYSPMHRIAIDQHKLELWPGWITSIQSLDGGVKLSVDASFRVLRLETVRDILLEINRRGRGNLKEAFEQELVGSIIMTRYNNKTYRIDGIDLNKKPTDTFVMSREDNREISYVDYMQQQWNITVRDHNQPLLIHNPKPKRGQETLDIMYLIPELCVTTGLTDEMRSNFQIMKAIAEHTRLPPQIRETKFTEFIESLANDEASKTILSNWNITLNPKLEVIPARKLETESLVFGNERTIRVQDNADWTQTATNSQMLATVDIVNWVLMVTERDANIAQDFLSAIREVSRNLGIKFSPPRVVKLPNDAPTTYVNYGKREVRRADQLVVIMTPGRTQREDRYSACKRLYSCEMPIPCQFIRCGTVSDPRKLRSVTQKVVIQMLCKVGGQPWGMKLPMKSFMIVGIDVYHDTIDGKKSCVGFVASMNQMTSSWWSHTFFQNSLEEIGQKLSSTMISAMRKFHSTNGFTPERIIVYRDGVGDGQLDAVLEFEIPQIMNGIKFYMRDSSNSGSPEPQISYIIVQKRINAKICWRAGNRAQNPPPGTFLDHTITHPEYNDFYLVSQHVNQGTVSPTKYIVLTETGTLQMQHHQKLAYKMTHMYFNWCGTIRVPAPCQYAHKLAYLTGQNIRQQANEQLEDKLYYL